MASFPLERRAFAGTLLALAACSSAPASFPQVQSRVFKPSCSFAACHGGPNGAGGLVFDGTASDHARLLSGASASGTSYVIPGNAEGSYLVQKLRGESGIAGTVMPPDAKLDDDTLELVISWIEAGAAAN